MLGAKLLFSRYACSSAGNIQRWHYLDYWIDGWIIGTDSGSVFSWRYADRVSGSDDLFGLYAADPDFWADPRGISGRFHSGVLPWIQHVVFSKSGLLASIYPFSAALILVGFDMSEYAGTTASSTPLLAVIGVGIMVLWAVLLLLMSSNKKEMKSRKQANAKGKGKRAVRRKGR